MKCRIGLIIFARNSSRRFPRKAMMKINNRELLGHVIDRAKMIGEEYPLVLATSTHSSDDEIERFAKEEEIKIFRGDLNNVLQRAIDCCRENDFTDFARICGDRPLFCPEIVKKIIEFHKNNNFQLTTNIKKRTYPSGFSCEVVNLSILKSIRNKITNKEDYEHITKFFYDNPSYCKVYNFESPIKGIAHFECTVDYPEDIIKISKIMGKNNHSSANLNFNEIVENLKKYYSS